LPRVVVLVYEQRSNVKPILYNKAIGEILAPKRNLSRGPQWSLNVKDPHEGTALMLAPIEPDSGS